MRPRDLDQVDERSLPAVGTVGHAAKAALAFTGFAAGLYVLFAVALMVIGAVMRWAGTREARR